MIMQSRSKFCVMPGLVPGIHVLLRARKAWMAGTSPAMTMWIMLGQFQMS
jgi:hypothetical protein